MKLTILALATVLTGVTGMQAASITYIANLSGANENPSNASPGTGSAVVTIDTVAHTLQVDVTFSGLSGTTTAAHIHCCVAAPGNVGVATVTPTLTGFPSGVTSGAYSHIFDTTLTGTFNAPFVTANGGTAAGAEAALANGLAAGTAYLNIHTSTFGGGEIRGFLTPVPEPGTFVLAGFALAGVVIRRRRSAL